MLRSEREPDTHVLFLRDEGATSLPSIDSIPARSRTSRKGSSRSLASPQTETLASQLQSVRDFSVLLPPTARAVARQVVESPNSTVSEIQRATGFSRAAVYHHLGRLMHAGLIERRNGAGGGEAWPHPRLRERLAQLARDPTPPLLPGATPASGIVTVIRPPKAPPTDRASVRRGGAREEKKQIASSRATN